jgi:hypothetical protein
VFGFRFGPVQFGIILMKKTLLAGIAALLMATSAAHAGSPWTEADGEDVIFIAIKRIACEGVNYGVWQPYNVKLQKQLDFLRLTPLSDTPITGKFTHTDQGWFRNGKLCEDLQS